MPEGETITGHGGFATEIRRNKAPLSWQVHRIYEVPNVINLHVIGDSVIRVERYVVYRDGVVMMRPESPVIASSLCGDTFALILESGDLVIPHRNYTNSQSNPSQGAIATIRFHMHIFESRKVQIAASRRGRYVCINSADDQILLFEYSSENSSIMFKSSIEAPHDRRFGLTEMWNIPYVWMLIDDSNSGVSVELYSFDPFEPFHYCHEPVAKCPITTSRRSERALGIYMCASGETEGVICSVDDQVYYIGYKQIVIGDLTNGLVKCDHSVRLITTSSTGNGNLDVYISRSESGMVRVDPEASGEGVFSNSTVAATIDSGAKHFTFNKWLQYAAVVPPKKTADVSEPIIYAEKTPHRVRTILMDSRKRPWRLLRVDDRGIQTISLAKKPNDQVISGIKCIQTMSYERNLQVSVVTSTTGQNRYLHTQPEVELPSLKGDEPLLSFKMVEETWLVYVYPSEVQVYSAVRPLQKLNSIKLADICTECENEASILNAAFGLDFCVVTTYDCATVINLKARSDTADLLLKRLPTESAPITFVRCYNDEIVVGMDFTIASYREDFETKSNAEAFSRKYLLDPEKVSGCVAFFDKSGNLLKAYLQSFVPSGWHAFANGDELVLYGSRGLVLRIVALESDADISSSIVSPEASSDNEDCLDNSDEIDGEDVTVSEKLKISDDDGIASIHRSMNADFFLDKHRKLEPLSLEQRNYEHIVLDLKTSVEWGDVTADGSGVILRGTNLYALSQESCQRLAGTEEYHGKTANYISSCIMVDDTTVGYIEKQQLKFVSDANLYTGPEPFILKAHDMDLPRSLQLLLIQSQRVVLVYGSGNVRFLDSLTLKPVLVHGVSSFATWKALTLWKFQENDKSYEHLLVFDGVSKAIESYTIQREGTALVLSLKFRSSLPGGVAQIASEPTEEIIIAHGETVYFSSGLSFKSIRPGYSWVYDEIKLYSPALKVSITEGYVVITCTREILILKPQAYEKLEIMEIISDESINFLTHVAQLVLDPNLHGHIYILATVRETKSNSRIRLMGIDYSLTESKATGMSASYEVPRLSLLNIRDLVENPTEERPAKSLKAFAVMSDDSICAVELSPPEMQEPKTITVY